MLEKALSWFYDRKGRVVYSMRDRNGPESYDCSSSEYHALIEAGLLPSTVAIGNTDSLFNDLERHGFVQVAEQSDGSIPTQRGDVFIWGIRGRSSGDFGHTGMFVDADNIIHCSSGYNGIAISNHDWLWALNGKPPVTVYRYVGTPERVVNNPTDQVVEVGSWVKFDRTYRVDGLQFVAHMWQVKTDELCKVGFTWEDNGIPAGLVTEVDSEGYATDDQGLEPGSLYKIPGKFNVLDVGLSNGEWLAQVGAGGLTFWVDIETATEVGPDDPGTPNPSQRQKNVEVPPSTPATQPAPTPEVPPVTPPQTPVPEQPQAPVQPPVAVPTPIQEPTPSVPVEETPTPAPAKRSLLDVLIEVVANHSTSISDYITANIRTWVPLAVGSVASWLGLKGVHLDTATTAALGSGLTGTVGALYYALVHLLEKKWAKVGYLLGVPKQPSYNQ